MKGGIHVPVSRRYCIESLITLGIPSFSPSYPIKSSNGTAKIFARVGVGRTISRSSFEFSLQRPTQETMKRTPPETYGERFLLIDRRGYVDLSERDMSCEFGERIRVRDLPEELGADDCPCEREQHWPRQIRPSEKASPNTQMLRIYSLLVKKLE
jgi:hypothetical protein